MRKVIIIGGGVAGMQTAISLSERGISSVIIEKEETLGGKVRGWYKLFPSMTPAEEVLDSLKAKVAECKAEVLLSTEVTAITPKSVTLASGAIIEGNAVVIATGYDIFPAQMKEEYGYKLYDNVYTTVDIETMMRSGEIKNALDKTPERIALLHCVGSRDEKVCQKHCSRVCCIEGVKMAMELKQMLPDSEIFNFYMDMRMFGPGYEEMYRQAQEQYNIHFVRGRISEASQTIDGRIQVKAEDTLVGRPIKMSVDMLILIVGMKAPESNAVFASEIGAELYASGFFKPKNIFEDNVLTASETVYVAGTASAPKNIGESINEGIAVATRIANKLS